MKTTQAKAIPVIIHTGMGYEIRFVETVSFWQGVSNITIEATSEKITSMLNEAKNKKENAILTASGNFYTSSDTPGYCDGDNRIDRIATELDFITKIQTIKSKIKKINFDENGNPIGDRSYAFGLFDEQELWEDRLFTLQCRAKESLIELTIDSIDKALKSIFHIDPELLFIIEAATNADYITRLSHTQAQWTEQGLAKARIELNRLKQ